LRIPRNLSETDPSPLYRVHKALKIPLDICLRLRSSLWLCRPQRTVLSK